MRALVIMLALVACKDDKPPPLPPAPTATLTPTPTPKPTPEAETLEPGEHGITVTPKGKTFELTDGKFTLVFPDEPKLEVDPADGTITAEGGQGTNVYTLSIIHGDEIEGKEAELPLVIGGIFEGLEGKLGKQTPHPNGLKFEGSAKDAGDSWQVIGWTLAQPKTKRIYVLMFQLPNDRTFTKQEAEAIASTLKLL